MATMFKKYMLKLTNTVGTVQYLSKITKDNDSNNNNHSSDHNGSKRKSNKKYRNSMTAEMLLDIGPLLPSARRTSHQPSMPARSPPPTPPSPIDGPDALRLFDAVPQRPVRHRSLDDCNTAGYRTPTLSSENDTDGEEAAVHGDVCDSGSSRRSSSNDGGGGGGDSDDDPMAVLSAAILELRNTLLYYSLVLPMACERDRDRAHARVADGLMRYAPVFVCDSPANGVFMNGFIKRETSLSRERAIIYSDSFKLFRSTRLTRDLLCLRFWWLSIERTQTSL